MPGFEATEFGGRFFEIRARLVGGNDHVEEDSEFCPRGQNAEAPSC